MNNWHHITILGVSKMTTIYAIENNGLLLHDIFHTLDAANKYIAEFDNEERYLMSTVSLDENEFNSLLTIQYYFKFDNDKIEFKKAIDESDNQSFIYCQLSRIDSDNWINTQYMQHVKYSLLSGGYASVESFKCAEMLSYDDFCDQLRKDIDYAQDYDSAIAKYRE